jgi:hypothetical protein
VSQPVQGGPVETIIESGCGWSELVGVLDSAGFSELRGNAEKADKYWRRAWASIGLEAPAGPVLEPGEGDCLRWFDRGYGHLVGLVQLSLLLEYRQSADRR